MGVPRVWWSCIAASGRPDLVVISAETEFTSAAVALPKGALVDDWEILTAWRKIAVETLYCIAAVRPDYRHPLSDLLKIQQMLASRQGVAVRYLGNYIERKMRRVGHLFAVEHRSGWHRIIACRFEKNDCHLAVYPTSRRRDFDSIEIMYEGLQC
ncbi:hypothetical protein [Pirellula sp. SH-Sr6A]|uniref:hypothetical protein n=1 Tax=Pirellula sp. SH-Sr6A TaxID=1632865 RepID=UPI0011BAB58B|nr:hypothetical protein [Pirellula sp. SH-Sr6A]